MRSIARSRGVRGFRDCLGGGTPTFGSPAHRLHANLRASVSRAVPPALCRTQCHPRRPDENFCLDTLNADVILFICQILGPSAVPRFRDCEKGR